MTTEKVASYYDYKDAAGHYRGKTARGTCPCVYHLVKIENGMATLESKNAWGAYLTYVYPVHTVEPIDKR